MKFDLILLVIATIICVYMILYLMKKGKTSNLIKMFNIIFLVLIVHCIGLILQILFKNTDIPPIFFDSITYTAGVYLPVILLYISLIFLNTDINLNKISWLFIVPTITLFMVWTNKFHHLFYIKYSINMADGIVGPMFVIHSIYSYTLLITAIIILVISSIKKSGFFSKQTALIVIGSLVPIVVNILGTFKIISISVYITPILYIVTAVCYSLAIIKYKALSITPIAFKTVINTMSDSFVVISDEGDVVDFNTTFDNTLGKVLNITKDGNLFDILSKNKLIDVNDLKKHIIQTRKNKSIITEEYNIKSENFNRFYEVDIHPIKASKAVNYVGTLLLFKDVTQHKIDLQAIKDKQDVIVKQGQLVSIGELAGGVAHDINTPISGIKTGLQMLTEMDTPRSEVETELLYRMTNCADKIIKIVNSMRNQIRNLGSDQMSKFKISTVIEDIRIIAYNEIQKNHCELIVNIVDDVSVYGDPTKLGQVFTNLIVNAVQAYNGKGGKVEIIVTEAPNNKIMIRVKDYAGGIPENIKEFVFKNILTTKGTKGTGLGLYLAYSVIKGEFSGEISFDSKVGEGTTFIITLNKA